MTVAPALPVAGEGPASGRLPAIGTGGQPEAPSTGRPVRQSETAARTRDLPPSEGHGPGRVVPAGETGVETGVETAPRHGHPGRSRADESGLRVKRATSE